MRTPASRPSSTRRDRMLRHLLTPLALGLLLASLGLGLAFRLAAPAAASAQAEAGQPTLEVEAGFDGLGKAGRWLPVRVTVANDGPALAADVRLVSRAPLGPGAAYGRTVDLPTRSRKLLHLAAPAPASARELRVELLGDGRQLAERELPVRLLGAGEFLIGVLAEDDVPPAGLGSLRRGGGTVSVARLSPGDLPTEAVALQALDAIVVRNAATGRLTREQRAALRAWVEAGGQLLVAGGPGWRRTIEGLEDLLPVEGLWSREVKHLRALGRYAGGSPPDGNVLLTIGSPTADARVFLTQDAIPLIVERWLGQGRVTFLAADPSLEPFRAWPGAEGLWQRVLVGGRPLFPAGDEPGAGAFESQLRVVLVELLDLGLPPPGWLALFLAIYVLCVGPLQHAVLRRIDRREWAWIGFPALALAFAGLAYLGGTRLRGPDVHAGAVSIVRSAPGAATAPTDTWVGLVAPSRRSYDVEFVDGASLRALPGGDGLGAGGLAGDPTLIELGRPTRLPDLRLEGRTLQAFQSRAFGPAPTPARADLRTTSGRLEGLVTNAGPDRLEDALLLVAGETLALGTIAPGESRPVSLALPTTRVPGGGFRPAPASADRAEQRRALAMALLARGGEGEATGGALLLAWAGATPPRLTAGGEPVAGAATRLLQQALPVHYGDDHVVVPPGLLGRAILDGAALNRGGAVTAFVARGPIVFQYDLPAEVSLAQIDRLSVHLALGGRPGPPPVPAPGAPPPAPGAPPSSSTVRVSLFRWADRTWVEAPLVSTGVADLPFGAQFVDGGAIRVRLESNGPEALVHQLDLSLEGPRR